MTDDELLDLMKRFDPETVRLPPGIKEIAREIESIQREACAKVCDEMAGSKPPEPDGYDARDLADYSVWEALTTAAMKIRSNVTELSERR